MSDTSEPQPLADTEDPLIDAWVHIDMLGPYEAKIDPTKRWKGSASPRFTLDTVRKIAAHTQEQAGEYNYNSVETIHVIDGGTDHEGKPRAVVLHVRWCYIEDEEEAQYATLVMQPDDAGLYSVGGDDWNWYETAPAIEASADERP